MTTLVAVTQRVAIDPVHGERRDALDQRWTRFLGLCGLTPLLLPNEPAAALRLVATVPVCGVLLTGGNSLVHLGGNAPERDHTEAGLIAWARRTRRPLLGVCRGMQILLNAFGVPLQPVHGHAGQHHALLDGRVVNSYHDFGALSGTGPFIVTARCVDGVVEAVCHPEEPVQGLMWHPERNDPAVAGDVALFRDFFGVRQ